MYYGDVIYKMLQSELHFTMFRPRTTSTSLTRRTGTPSSTFISRIPFGPLPISGIERTLFSAPTSIKIFLKSPRRGNTDDIATKLELWLWSFPSPIRCHRELNLYLIQIKPHFNINGVNIVFDRESGQNVDKSFGSKRPRNYCLDGFLTNTRQQ